MSISNPEISCPCMISEGENTSPFKPKSQHKLQTALVVLKYPSEPKRTSLISKLLGANKKRSNMELFAVFSYQSDLK